MNHEITLRQAVLGDEVEVEGLNENLKLGIPAGTQPGSEFELKELGAPISGSKYRGSLIVRIQVQLPKDLNEEQRKDFEKLMTDLGQ